MNLLHMDRAFGIGGGPTFLKNLARMQRRNGHKVGLMAANGPMAESLAEDADFIKRATFFSMLQKPLLASFLRKHEIDVLDCHSRSSARVCLAAARASGAKMVLTSHGIRDPKRIERLREVFTKSDGVMAVDEQLARLYLQMGFSRKQIFLGRLFIEWPSRPRRTQRNARVFAYCSRLSTQKGPLCEAWLRAIALLRTRPERIVVIGDGSYRQKINQTASELRLDVEMLGAIPDADQHFDAVDVLTGASFVTLEGFRAQCACVGMGFDGCIGAIDVNNLRAAIAVNFGDRVLRKMPLDSTLLVKELERAAGMVEDGEASEVADVARSLCSAEAVEPNFEGFFRCVNEGRDFSEFSLQFDLDDDPAKHFDKVHAACENN